MKIICVGRNYVDHIKELENQTPENPVLFIKPDSAILPKKNAFYIPDFTKEVHYEIELIIRISRVGKYIDKQFAHKYYETIGLGIDFTARDIQSELKKKGLPWEIAKGFDGGAVIGEFTDKEELGDLASINFRLERNGEIVQTGNSEQMIWKIDELIEYISQYFTLKIGDIIFTGTPAGVGAVKPGDELTGFLEEKEMFSVKIK